MATWHYSLASPLLRAELREQLRILGGYISVRVYLSARLDERTRLQLYLGLIVLNNMMAWHRHRHSYLLQVFLFWMVLFRSCIFQIFLPFLKLKLVIHRSALFFALSQFNFGQFEVLLANLLTPRLAKAQLLLW